MANNLYASYPLQSKAPTAGYPYGSAQDISTPGDNSGTPWRATIYDDILGFQQALLDAAGIVPSGNADQVGASQYLDALYALFSGGSGDFMADGSVPMTGNLQTNSGIIHENASVDMTITVNNPNQITDNGTFRVQGVDDSGDLWPMIIASPDSGVSLTYQAQESARTVSQIQGGLEAFNAYTGAGWERVLTSSDVPEDVGLPGYTRTVTKYNRYVTDSYFYVPDNQAIATYGRTGSTADVIVPQLDEIPVEATTLIVSLEMQVAPANTRQEVYSDPTGTGLNFNTSVAKLTSLNSGIIENRVTVELQFDNNDMLALAYDTTSKTEVDLAFRIEGFTI